MTAARPLVSLLAACTLAACTTQTIETGAPRTVRTAVGEAPPVAAGPPTLHHYVEGELILRFSAEGARTIAPVIGKPPGRLRFGVPSLDRLNAKYRATQIVPLVGERGAYLLRIATDANVFRAVEEYGHEPLVAGAVPNYAYRLPSAAAPEAVRTQTGPLKRDTPQPRPRAE